MWLISRALLSYRIQPRVPQACGEGAANRFSNINVNVAKIYHELKIFKTGAAESEGNPIISLA